MILAQSVEIDGVVLCKDGTELTTKVILRLTNRKVPSVTVEATEELSDEQLSARDEAALTALGHRYRRASADPFMQGVMAVFERKLAAGRPNSSTSPGDDDTD